MIKESFLQNPVALSELRQALSKLHQINFFGLMMEICADRNAPAPVTADPTAYYAKRAAWADGYHECLKDMFEFFERYHVQAKTQDRRADFGGAEDLYQQGDITADEYAGLTGRPAPTRN